MKCFISSEELYITKSFKNLAGSVIMWKNRTVHFVPFRFDAYSYSYKETSFPIEERKWLVRYILECDYKRNLDAVRKIL